MKKKNRLKTTKDSRYCLCVVPMHIFMIIFLIISAILVGCENRNRNGFSTHHISDSSKIYFIDFEQNLKNTLPDTGNINSISKNIRFIFLEVTPKSLLSNVDFMVAEIDKNYYVSSFVSSTFSGILEFDSMGRFKNYLVQIGRGPKELPRMLDWSYNNNMQQIVATSGYELLLHSFERNAANKYSLPEFFARGCLLNDGSIVGLPYPFGIGATDVPYLSFLNQEGILIKSLFYPQKRDISFNLVESQGDTGPLEAYGLYPDYSGNALFKDVFNDTIYRITSMDDVKPYIVLNRGLLTPKVKDATDRRAKSGTIIVRGIIETEKYFFIKYAYKDVTCSAIWDKHNLTLIANSVANNSNEHLTVINNKGFIKYRTPNEKEILIGISSYSDGKLYCVLRADQAMDFLPNVDEYDNPILMVIDLK